MDIPRTGVGKPELHGFAVQGASRLREDPAPLAFLHRKREPRDGGRRDLRAGSSVNQPAYAFPETPLLYFFEGGAYGEIAFQTVPGDQFIGGSASGYREPTFNDGGAAAGIDAQNATYDFSGGAQHSGVFSAGRGKNDHNQVAHRRLHWLADLCRWHDLPHLERLGHHDHACIRADDRGERRHGGVRQQATPDRLRIDSGPAGRDIGEARRGYHSACSAMPAW